MEGLGNGNGVESGNSSLLDKGKFDAIVQSQQALLSKFGGSEEAISIEEAMKAQYGHDEKLLDKGTDLSFPPSLPLFNDEGSKNAITADCIIEESAIGFAQEEFNASSFFDDDDDDALMDRAAKRPRLVSPTESDDTDLHQERRMISRSVLDQIMKSYNGDGTLKNNDDANDNDDTLTGMSPYSMDLNLNSTTKDDILPDLKSQMRRVSLDLLNKSLYQEATESTLSADTKELDQLKKSVKGKEQPVEGNPQQQPRASSLECAIAKSLKSQQDIQDWDRKMGLNCTHSRTMILSSKTRKQVLELLKGGKTK